MECMQGHPAVAPLGSLLSCGSSYATRTCYSRQVGGLIIQTASHARYWTCWGMQTCNRREKWNYQIVVFLFGGGTPERSTAIVLAHLKSFSISFFFFFFLGLLGKHSQCWQHLPVTIGGAAHRTPIFFPMTGFSNCWRCAKLILSSSFLSGSRNWLLRSFG